MLGLSDDSVNGSHGVLVKVGVDAEIGMSCTNSVDDNGLKQWIIAGSPVIYARINAPSPKGKMPVFLG
jgi:hypothetical protein